MGSVREIRKVQKILEVEMEVKRYGRKGRAKVREK